MFGRKKTAERRCSAGHVMEESWERCPYCEAEKNPLTSSGENGTAAPAAAADTAPPDPGQGAVVVPKKAPAVRPPVGWLVALDGEEQGRDFRLHAGRNVVGKGAKADVIIRDAYLSEKHAVVEAGPDGYTIADLGSKHGTFLQGHAVRDAVPLRDGEQVRVGRTRLKFRSFEE
jgi:hypothetical protein